MASKPVIFRQIEKINKSFFQENAVLNVSFPPHYRLFWPKSKSYDYLYSDGEALLRNFPIQATICFYDESDSEDSDDEQDDWDNEEDSDDDKECLKPQGHFCNYN